MSEFNKRQSDRRAATCKHFNGIQHDACRVGVKYLDVDGKGPPNTGRHLPCLPNWKSGEHEGSCMKREFPTAAEIAAEEARFKKSLADVMAVRADIVENIGPWKKGEAESGQTPCVACKTGTVSFSRSGYNGHIHAACSTPDCVRWME